MSDDAIPLPTIRSRGTLMTAAGLLRPPGKPRARAPDRRTGSAFEIADDGRQFVEPARQGERIGGDDIEAGEPRSVVLLAPLGDDVAEHVELVEHRVKPQIAGSRAGAAPDPALPVDFAFASQARKPSDETPQLSSSFDHRPLDGGLRVGEEARCRHHRLEQGERLDAIESRHEGARLFFEHPDGERADGHGGSHSVTARCGGRGASSGRTSPAVRCRQPRPSHRPRPRRRAPAQTFRAALTAAACAAARGIGAGCGAAAA